MKKLLLILTYLSSATIFAQVDFSAGKIQTNYKPQFYIDFINYFQSKSVPKSQFIDSTDLKKTILNTLIQIPYSNIQFKRSSKGYSAKYNVTLTVYDEEKERVIQEKLWSEKLFTSSYKKTFSKNSFNISNRVLKLFPGVYHVKCTVEDQNSSSPIIFGAKVNVRAFTKPIEISDVLFIKKIIKKNNVESFIPNVSHRLENKSRLLQLYYEIYSDKPQNVLIKYIVNDLSRGKSYMKVDSLNLIYGKNQVIEKINDANLNLGSYELSIRVNNYADSTMAGIKNKFFIALHNLPVTIRNLDDAIEQMKYIASETLIDSMLEANNFDLKLKTFLSFWKNKDPDPKTAENEVMNEYYKRVEFSNLNFKSYTSGWNTDMGMIYISLGPPDQIERNPVAMSTKPYEIWTYYELNTQFVFQDDTGFGDYHLLNPQYGEWDRNR